MYYPFLRGKQFELIALRELAGLMAQKRSKISPIVEPVKNSSTLKTTLRTFVEQNINFNVIVNPTVGDLQNDPELIFEIIRTFSGDYNNYQFGIILEDQTDYTRIIREITALVTDPKFTFIHYSVRNDINDIIRFASENGEIVNNVIHAGKASSRYRREFDVNTLVSLDDFFQMLPKNADYLNVPSSRFTEEHLFFSEEGFKGFGDYLTIGEQYSDSGFLPWAVAIHISYLDGENKIRIKHFASDSNDDNDDVAGKFSEALEKLIDWCNAENINGMAIDYYRDLHERQHFPGLGVLKKLSVINHIELVLNAI